jgi:hypothetical protein
MEQVFSNLQELMDFDLSALKATKSNYISVRFINGRPKVKKSQRFSRWRVVAKPSDTDIPRVIMELTPRWLTVTVYEGKTFKTRQASFEILKKDPKIVIQEIFEF